MRCFLYNLYDRFKQTVLASKLHYYGARFRHFGPIVQSGVVTKCFHQGGDGDDCFDLVTVLDGQWHCEVTPCASKELRELTASLNYGDKVTVSGTKTFDPDHHIGPKKFKGGGWEIHPVTDITNVTIKT